MNVLSAFSLTHPYNADDGTVVRASSWSLHDFVNIVPPTAVVSGIVVECKVGIGPNLTPPVGQFTVYSGLTASAPKLINEPSYVAYPSLSVVTIGSSTDTWGLLWTPALAKSITVNTTFATGNTAYWDYVKVYIYYDPDPQPSILIKQGLVTIGRGQGLLNIS